MVKKWRLPPGHGGVALHADDVNSGCDVVGIGGGIVIGLMARETLCRHVGIVTRIVTLVTVIDQMALGQRKAGMVKNGRLPARHGGVALHANVTNSGGEVVGIGGGIVIGLMARETLRRHVGIVTRIMTLVAVGNGMTKGERKERMIKLCRLPFWCGGMTFHTICGQIGSQVIWIGGSIKIFLVTGKTLCRCTGIISAGMTKITVKYGMSQGEGERSMVKARSCPGKGSHEVAIDTLGGEIPEHMIWILG